MLFLFCTHGNFESISFWTGGATFASCSNGLADKPTGTGGRTCASKARDLSCLKGYGFLTSKTDFSNSERFSGESEYSYALPVSIVSAFDDFVSRMWRWMGSSIRFYLTALTSCFVSVDASDSIRFSGGTQSTLGSISGICFSDDRGVYRSGSGATKRGLTRLFSTIELQFYRLD